MNRKVMKILSVLMVALMFVFTISNFVLAEDYMNPAQFENKQDSSGAATTAQNIIGSIISIVQVVGMGVAIIMLIVLAIKYISAAPSEKAEIKKGVTIYVVGAVILFASTGILGIVKNFATNTVKAS